MIRAAKELSKRTRNRWLATTGLELCLKILTKGDFSPPFISLFPSFQDFRGIGLTFLAKFTPSSFLKPHTANEHNGPYSQFTSEKSLVKHRNLSMFIIPHLLSGIKKYFLCKKYNMKLILTRKDSYFKDILHNRIWDSNLIMHPSVQFSCSVMSNSLQPHGL